NGSPSYYRCSKSPKDCKNYVGGVYTGVKWQCVEFIRRYYWIVYHLNLGGHSKVSNAKTWYDNAAVVNLDRFPNCRSSSCKPNVIPQPGDILVSKGGKYGHVAIVKSVSNGKVDIIQQNYFESIYDT